MAKSNRTRDGLGRFQAECYSKAYPDGPLACDAWFAGFVDGEGCFLIRGFQRGTAYAPWFSLVLRADDEEILKQLHATFGGRIEYVDGQEFRNSKVRWRVEDKASLALLVTYFDRFPLRAKKRRDYTVWRAAVLIYMQEGWRAKKLASLKDELQRGRRYSLPAVG